MKNIKQRPIQRRIELNLCTIFRLAKPAFFRYGCLLEHLDGTIYKQDRTSFRVPYCKVSFETLNIRTSNVLGTETFGCTLHCSLNCFPLKFEWF